MWSGSPSSYLRWSVEVLKKLFPALRSKKDSGLTLSFSLSASFAITAGLVASSTQSNWHSTVNGRITFPYSDCL